MKILNKLDNTGMLNEATNKKFVSDAEKAAITHNNRSVIDSLGDDSGKLTYNGSSVAPELQGITWGDLAPPV